MFQVLNGLAADAPRLQQFCGTVPAGTQVRSSGNTMAIVFHTDASVSSGGFMASYFSDEPAGEMFYLAKVVPSFTKPGSNGSCLSGPEQTSI